MRSYIVLFALPLVAQTTVNGTRDWVRVSPPANAPAGKLRQYANNTTGKLACVDENGGDCMPVGSGGGSSVSRTLDAPASTIVAGDTLYSYTKTLTAGSLANKRLKVVAHGTHVNDLIGSMRWRLCSNSSCSTVVAECNPGSGPWLSSTTGAWMLDLDVQFFGAGSGTAMRGACRFHQSGGGFAVTLPSSGTNLLPAVDVTQTLYLRIVSYGAWSGGGRSATLDRVLTEIEALP
ncbi:MAG: hypothetical protein U0Q16_25915 [Bryobacteraceae bacterium]